MKKINYLIIAILLLNVTGCDDSFIDLEPTNVLGADLAFQSIEDVEAGLLGAYTTLRTTHARNFSMLPDIMGDHTTLPDETLGNERFMHAWTYQAGDGTAAGLWSNSYLLIERANVILEELEIFRPDDASLADQIRGEALALRGLSHFDLTRYFSDNYSVGGLGVAVKLKSRVITEPIRESVTDTYVQILADLTEAKTLLARGSDGNIGRFSEMGVTALLARVSLYAEDYEAAITYATEVIDAYPITTRETFDNLWRSDIGTGSIMQVVYTASDATIGGVLYGEESDQLNWHPSEELISLYDQLNDVRFASYFRTRPGGTILIDNKYSGREVGGTVTNPQLVNFQMFRVEEQYLIRAEAHLLKASPSVVNASLDLNALRAERITGYADEVFADVSTLLDAIAIERQKELCFEGHRWFDLKRFDLSVTRGTDCDDSGAANCSLDVASEKWLIPIPQNELFANPNMVQNNGY